MAFYFLDTSALVKYYILEPGSSWIRSLIDTYPTGIGQPLNAIVIAELSLVEAAAAFAILHRMDRLRRKLRDTAFSALSSDITSHRYQVMPILSNDIVVAANLTQDYPLKAYDAMQLAVAIRLRSVLLQRGIGVIFISGDQTQLTAAQIEGMQSQNPFDHVQPQDTPQTKS